MDELLVKAGVPTDGTFFIGKLITEPFLSNALNQFIGARYSLHVRPLLFSGVIQNDSPSPTGTSEKIHGEIVLASADRVPVQITGFERITPSPEAQESGFWRPEDEFFSIRSTDLTPEQAKQACYFVRPYPPGVVGKLFSREE